MHAKFWLENLKEKTVCKTQAEIGECIKIYHREIGCKGVDWICVTQDRDHSWAHVSMVINLWLPKNVENSLNT